VTDELSTVAVTLLLNRLLDSDCEPQHTVPLAVTCKYRLKIFPGSHGVFCICILLTVTVRSPYSLAYFAVRCYQKAVFYMGVSERETTINNASASKERIKRIALASSSSRSTSSSSLLESYELLATHWHSSSKLIEPAQVE
jgi:hypothetical protein